MLLQAILLFIVVPASLGDVVPVVQTLPEKQFTASSSYNDSVKAPNVRFPTEESRMTMRASEEPWCPAFRDDYDYYQEFVTVDFGCPREVRAVLGKDRYLRGYNSQYSNDKRRWKILAYDFETEFGVKFITANNSKLIEPSVRARFFRFRPVVYDYSSERGFQPCIKAELFGEPDREDSAEPMGCFEETKKQPLTLVVYHTVKLVRLNKKFPDILAIYQECREKITKFLKPLEIFGIMNYDKCVTSESGKAKGFFKNARRSRNKCKECFGKGIGAKETAIFVYKIIKEKY